MQLPQTVFITFADDVCGVHFTTGQFLEFLNAIITSGVGSGADRQGDQHFFDIQADRLAVENVLFQPSDVSDNHLGQ